LCGSKQSNRPFCRGNLEATILGLMTLEFIKIGRRIFPPGISVVKFVKEILLEIKI
jgi:hypothetical protein